MDQRGLRTSKLHALALSKATPQSAVPDFSGWSADGGASLVSGQKDPLGGSGAYLLKEDNSNGIHTAYQYPTNHADTEGDNLASVIAKPAGRRWIHFYSIMLGGMWFDLLTATVGSNTSNGTNTPRGKVVQLADGWVECRMATQYGPPAAAYGYGYFRIHLCDADLSTSYQGDGASGVLLYRPVLAVLGNSSWDL